MKPLIEQNKEEILKFKELLRSFQKDNFNERQKLKEYFEESTCDIKNDYTARISTLEFESERSVIELR